MWLLHHRNSGWIQINSGLSLLMFLIEPWKNYMFQAKFSFFFLSSNHQKNNWHSKSTRILPWIPSVATVSCSLLSFEQALPPSSKRTVTQHLFVDTDQTWAEFIPQVWKIYSETLISVTNFQAPKIFYTQ